MTVPNEPSKVHFQESIDHLYEVSDGLVAGVPDSSPGLVMGVVDADPV